MQELSGWFRNNRGGSEPRKGVTAGNLYGASYANGTYHYGNIFKLTLSNGSWTYTDLYDFTGGNDGANPVGALTLDGNGNLYGTTVRGGGSTNCFGGCGVVFEIRHRQSYLSCRDLVHSG